MTTPWTLRCVKTGAEYPGDEIRYRSDSGGLLEARHDFARLDGAALKQQWSTRLGALRGADASGVWRYRELVLPLDESDIVSRHEGNTPLYDSVHLSRWTGIPDLLLKHEGHNPTGSFKDRGMTAGISIAKRLGQRCVACASTGNTSASMASYAAAAGMSAIVFIPSGAVSASKLAQAYAYGAEVVPVRGNFDDAMRLVQDVCREQRVYLLNSINPFRIEGQKAIGIELLHQLSWDVPDWIVLPGGNLGNTSAIFKGLSELRELGIIDRLPRFAVVQAAGAAPFYQGFLEDFGAPRSVAEPDTVATAIRIGAPVSWEKCARAVRESGGVVTSVEDREILDAKHEVDAAGIGAEPASCASVAGLRKLVESGVIDPASRAVCILTGHVLKDPDAIALARGQAEEPEPCEPNTGAIADRIARVIDKHEGDPV